MFKFKKKTIINRLIALIILIFCASPVYAQSNEFKVYPNGFIYSEHAMEKLSHIVDSLNLKFKTCDFNTVFKSKSQTIGHLVKLEVEDLEQAQKDMDQNISFDDFLKKYHTAEVDRNILVIKNKYKNYEGQEVIEIEHFNLKSDYGFSIRLVDVSYEQKDYANQWLYSYSETTSYSDASLTAFYFPENFSTTSIPKKYSEMIGYSDCLIDTTTTKFKDNMENGRPELPENWTSLSEEKKAKLLDEMRSTRVVGFCSMDSSPREHAVNIALLSAETYNWEVFLKAHLDIMNDRFSRMSDGSYAWGQRNTYIKELEALNINVTDLILGISFRIENPASNHYYGSIGRVGRALSETENRQEVENAILSIIADPELDHYNRLIFYFLFKNYNYHIQDEAIQKESQERLAKVVKELPEYFSEKLVEE